MGARQFGARVKRLEDPALLTGRGRFVDDVKLAGTLEACFVRSPYAHAKIRAIDATAARALPGVHAVLLASDLPGPMATQPIPMILPVLGIKAFRTQLCLARDEVSYAGQSVALVVA
jgi:carbon-monoxide dehydrogenase large subunit